MAKYYVTVADSMGQAANAFAAVQTGPDGGTMSTIKVPPNMKKISVIGTAVSPDGAQTLDTGNNFTIQLSGTGMVDGILELLAGSVCTQETGTSVTGDFAICGAHYRPVDINVKPGEITISAAFDGTDCGAPFIAVTLGFE